MGLPSSKRWCWVVPCVLASVVWTAATQIRSRASAQDDTEAHAALNSAHALLERARFDQAEALVLGLLAREGLAATVRNEALEVLAIVQIAGRKESKAQETLTQLFARDPDYHRRVADPGPTVESAFARARARSVAALHVVTQFELYRDAKDRVAMRVRLGEGRDATESVHAFITAEGDAQSSHLVATATPELELVLPQSARDAATVGVYLEARAPSGTVLGKVGNEDAPLQLDLPPSTLAAAPCAPSLKPLRREWWLWTTLAAVLGSITIGGAVATH